MKTTVEERLKSKLWREANHERHLKYCREWRIKNHDKAKAYGKQYIQANRTKVREWNRKRWVQKRNNGIFKTQQEYTAILEKDPCCYCGDVMNHVDHIEPITKNGSHEWSNLTASCSMCNHTKYNHRLLFALLKIQTKLEV